MAVSKQRWMVLILVAICMAVVVSAIPMLLSVIGHARDASNWARCAANLQQIGLALQSYHEVHGSYPPAYICDRSGKPILSWRVLILPDLQHHDVYSKVRFDEPWNGPHNIRLAASMPACYRCPTDSGAQIGETSYVAVIGAETLWPGAASRRVTDIARSRSTVIQVVETANARISWMEPRDVALANVLHDYGAVRGRHPCGGGDELFRGVYDGYSPSAVGYRIRGANCVVATGAVVAISEAASPKLLKGLLSVAPFDFGPYEGDKGDSRIH